MQISGGIVMSGNWNIPSISPAATPTVTYKWFMGEPTELAGTSNTIGISTVSWGRANLGNGVFTANNQILFSTYWFTSDPSRLNYYLTDAYQHNPTQSQQNVIINAMTTGTTLDFYRYNPTVVFAETLTLTDNARRQVLNGVEYIVANVNANFRDGVNDLGQDVFDNTDGNYNMFGFANVYFTSNILTTFPPTQTYKWFIGENADWSGTSNNITATMVTWGRKQAGVGFAFSNNQIVFQRPFYAPVASRANGYLSGAVSGGRKTLSNAEVSVFVNAMTPGTTIDFYSYLPTLFAETLTLTTSASIVSYANADYIVANVDSNFKDGVNDGPGENVSDNTFGNYFMYGFANINYTTNVLLSFPA
jgi:hypothetical protein